MINNASEPFRFIVCDNYSKGSDSIRSYFRELINERHITKALFFHENNIGWSLLKAYEDFPPDNSESFFIMTDLDLIVPDGCDWIKMIKDAHYQRKCILTGCSLELSNYVPPNGGHSEDGFGIWIVGINTDFFNKNHGSNMNIVDSRLISIANSRGKVEKLDMKLHHLAWDLWKDNTEYFDFKKHNLGWSQAKRPEIVGYSLCSLQ